MIVNTLRRELEKTILGKKGGATSSRIIEVLYERPANTNQLAKILDMHYTSITHQINILKMEDIVFKEEVKYGSLNYLSDEMLENRLLFEEIKEKII